MKNLKKLNAKGFGHLELLVIVAVVVVVGAIGTYMLTQSHAATITAAKCKKNGGVWLDLSGHGVDHGPCWDTPGAYLVNWGAGKTGDGIDQVPDGTNKSEKFDYPNYIIVVSGQWQACDDSHCTNHLDPFTHSRSAAYRTKGGGEGHLHGGAYTLCTYDFYWNGTSYTKLCTDKGIYIKRV